METVLSKEDYIRLRIELDKGTLKHSIIKKLFKDLPEDSIYKFQLFLPLNYNVRNEDFIDITFSKYIEVPTLVEKQHLKFNVPTPLFVPSEEN